MARPLRIEIAGGRFHVMARVWLAGTCVIIGLFWYIRQRQNRDFAERTACVGNLAYIKVAKSVCSQEQNLSEGDLIPILALTNHLGKSLDEFKCPKGGNYSIGKVGELPSCNYSNKCFTYAFDVSKFRVQRRAWVHSLSQ